MTKFAPLIFLEPNDAVLPILSNLVKSKLNAEKMLPTLKKHRLDRSYVCVDGVWYEVMTPISMIMWVEVMRSRYLVASS